MRATDYFSPNGDTATQREVMARFATGVVLLTTGGENVHGMTANAFTSVSLEPELVLCCVDHGAVMHKTMGAAERFGVSVMSAEHRGLARHFADKNRPLGDAQFTDVDWAPGPRTGAPLLSNALAWLECEVAETFEAGDHTIFLGRTLAAWQGSTGDGLLFFDGRFSGVTREW